MNKNNALTFSSTKYSCTCTHYALTHVQCSVMYLCLARLCCHKIQDSFYCTLHINYEWNKLYK